MECIICCNKPCICLDTLLDNMASELHSKFLNKFLSLDEVKSRIIIEEINLKRDKTLPKFPLESEDNGTVFDQIASRILYFVESVKSSKMKMEKFPDSNSDELHELPLGIIYESNKGGYYFLSELGWYPVNTDWIKEPDQYQFNVIKFDVKNGDSVLHFMKVTDHSKPKCRVDGFQYKFNSDLITIGETRHDRKS